LVSRRTCSRWPGSASHRAGRDDEQIPAGPVTTWRAPECAAGARHFQVSYVFGAKTPGQSDGQCDAAGGVRTWDYIDYTQPSWPTAAADQALFDPLWGIDDPAAGG
jgi:hypothetical protein